MISKQQAFNRFDAEMHFVKRLKDHGHAVFLGTSDQATRRERIRAAIVSAGLACAILGRMPNQKPETYAQAFERHYGEPLEPKQRKGNTAC